MPRVARGPKFVQYFGPVLQALKELGGSARPAEVVEVAARLKNIPEAQRQEVLQSGALRFYNQIAFARQYLVWGGYLDSSKRGVWSLTKKGLACPDLNEAEALKLFKVQHALHSPPGQKDADGQDEDGCVAAADDRQETISLMQEAIAFHLEGLAAENLPIPQPQSEAAEVEVNA